MNKDLKEKLENLPEGLILNKEFNSLDCICEDCGTIIHREIRQRNITEGPYYCRKCSAKHRNFSDEARKNIGLGAKKRIGKGICTSCGKEVEHRSASGFCSECQAKRSKNIVENLKSPGKCSICGKYNQSRDQNGRGRDIGYGSGTWINDKGEICGCNCSQKYYNTLNTSEEMIKHSIENCNKMNTYHKEYCKICKDETLHDEFGYCIVCNPRVNIPNFIIKNNVKFYKNEPVSQIIEKLERGEYSLKNFPKWNKRFGRWCYNTIDILNDEKLLYTGSNFTVKDNIKYVLDKSNGYYVLWDNIVQSHLKRLNNNNNNEEISSLINVEGFVKEPIFNNSDNPDMWNRSITDQYLKDKGYNWIVYIKLFKNKPFIVGKTGTTNVIHSGIDFDFRVGSNNIANYNSPGRQFIRENYPEYIGGCTDHEFVLVKNFASEDEIKALEFEKYIAIKYNLFES